VRYRVVRASHSPVPKFSKRHPILERSLCPDTRIVLFSGNVDTASLLDDASVEGYFFEILAKPVHPIKLLKTLNG
jgi:hypothetical protein